MDDETKLLFIQTLDTMELLLKYVYSRMENQLPFSPADWDGELEIGRRIEAIRKVILKK